ncbi:hypothetical protein SAMN05444266_104418 [Chitinophaga jiangningensis]|uniref:Low-complexity protein n=1 Tax=Chitinophaga jiangningensis TaxID=1419482 RepID=A0A1M7CP82_9BACT|nr:hypothetical protein [Chitinophaga jiangningensis]SHL69076.1 hypothetical protein SAMN05444266_104418 [Chitinophaga jiangningensis]
MENKKISKKVLFSGSLVAGAIMGLTAFANANPVNYSDMGNGAAVRTALTGASSHVNAIELACGATKDSTMKSKEGKCGEGKCGEGKCGGKKGSKEKGKTKDKAKKGKDSTSTGN